jgi:hypothetical protein
MIGSLKNPPVRATFPFGTMLALKDLHRASFRIYLGDEEALFNKCLPSYFVESCDVQLRRGNGLLL